MVLSRGIEESDFEKEARRLGRKVLFCDFEIFYKLVDFYSFLFSSF